ncbi:MAG: hypothetical protein K0R70_1200 [Steroidobacteraceae bacterium]|nr:hypothetical protein [Steroidobacteraceae bacterium]
MPTTAPSTLVVAATRDLDRQRIDTSTGAPRSPRGGRDDAWGGATTVPQEVTVTDANPAMLPRGVQPDATT